MPDGGRMDIAFRQDWRGGGGDDVGGRSRLDQSDRLDIADIMVVAAIAPGPTAGELEDGELLARQELGSRLALARRRSEEHTTELKSLTRISYAAFCCKKNTK